MLLDYDGTLVPIADRPDLAIPDDDLVVLLRSLAERPATTVHIVSGRPRAAMSEWFGDLHVSLWAEHGAFHRPATRTSWQCTQAIPPGWDARVLPILERFTAETPGSFIERKMSSVAWHYRMAGTDVGARPDHALRLALATALGAEAEALDVRRGRKIVEVRVRGVSKASAGRHVKAVGAASQLVLAVGDDETDDDLFDAVRPDGVTIAVGSRACAACHRVPGVTEVRDLLQRLL